MRQPYGLDHNIHQGYYGETFIRALAASAGLIATKPELDVTGEDLIIGLPGRHHSLRHPRIEVQVKSWSGKRGNRTNWRYPMRADHYNQLAGGFTHLPRYLFLVIVPEDRDQYMIADDRCLRLQHAAYWACFAHQQPTQAATVTVDVPRQNLLTQQALLTLFPTGATTAHPGSSGLRDNR